ncbi:MAG: hypothetical protein AAFX05_12595, partial [Planctomycetota bacterium]
MARSVTPTPALPPRRAPRALLAALTACLSICCPSAATAEPDSDPQGAISTLTDPTADASARAEAAQSLIDEGSDEAMMVLAASLLRNQPAGAREIVANAIARADSAPATLLQTLITATRSAGDDDAIVLLRALARYPDRRAAEVAFAFLERDPAAGPEVAAAAIDALTRQTAASPLTPEQWLEWWDRHERLTDAAWSSMVARNQADRAARVLEQRDGLAIRLGEVYRRLYALTPEEDRSAQIAELMRAERPELQRLGLDLARRALLNARPLGQRVVAASTELLQRETRDAQLRAAAADLLDKLDPPTMPDEAAAVLLAETHPDVAAPLLRLLARHPREGLTEAVVRWAVRDGRARAAAFDAGSALLAVGMLQPQTARRLAMAVDAVPDAELSLGAVRLLGEQGDAQRLTRLLASPEPALARAAASALVPNPEALDAILHAARSAPQLFDACEQAILLHRATTDGFEQLMSIPDVPKEALEDGLTAVARALSPTDLQRAANSVGDPRLRAQLLSHVVSPDFGQDVDADAHRDLVRELVRAHIDAANPTAALEIIESAWADPEPEDQRTQIMCLLWLGRLDDATEVSQTVEDAAAAWLDGLERVIDAPIAAEIAARLDQLFAETLDAAETERLAALRERIAPVPVSRSGLRFTAGHRRNTLAQCGKPLGLRCIQRLCEELIQPSRDLRRD